MSICYVKGDATKPDANGNRIIIHCCNDLGYWNAGFVKALSKQWPQSERAYRLWATGQDQALPFALGNVQFVPLATSLWVANIIGQSGIAKNRFSYPPPIRYEAIRKALQTVCRFALDHNASIHMPRMGAGLAGGNWQLIAEIVEAELCSNGVSVTLRPPLEFSPDSRLLIWQFSIIEGPHYDHPFNSIAGTRNCRLPQSYPCRHRPSSQQKRRL